MHESINYCPHCAFPISARAISPDQTSPGYEVSEAAEQSACQLDGRSRSEITTSVKGGRRVRRWIIRVFSPSEESSSVQEVLADALRLRAVQLIDALRQQNGRIKNAISKQRSKAIERRTRRAVCRAERRKKREAFIAELKRINEIARQRKESLKASERDRKQAEKAKRKRERAELMAARREEILQRRLHRRAEKAKTLQTRRFEREREALEIRTSRENARQRDEQLEAEANKRVVDEFRRQWEVRGNSQGSYDEKNDCSGQSVSDLEDSNQAGIEEFGAQFPADELRVRVPSAFDNSVLVEDEVESHSRETLEGEDDERLPLLRGEENGSAGSSSPVMRVLRLNPDRELARARSKKSSPAEACVIKSANGVTISHVFPRQSEALYSPLPTETNSDAESSGIRETEHAKAAAFIQHATQRCLLRGCFGELREMAQSEPPRAVEVSQCEAQSPPPSEVPRGMFDAVESHYERRTAEKDSATSSSFRSGSMKQCLETEPFGDLHNTWGAKRFLIFADDLGHLRKVFKGRTKTYDRAAGLIRKADYQRKSPALFKLVVISLNLHHKHEISDRELYKLMVRHSVKLGIIRV